MEQKSTIPGRTIRGGWAIDDQHVGVTLEDISVLSSRAHSMLSREAHPDLKAEGVMILTGAIRMMSGMEYHFANFAEECRRIAASGVKHRDLLVHEVVAYLNRMGQFHAFLRSDFVKPSVPSPPSVAPTLVRLLILRNKYAAHRSLDAPRDEPVHVRMNHELGMSGGLFRGRPGGKPLEFEDGEIVSFAELDKHLFENSYPSFQVGDHKTNATIDFTPETDHPVIIAECFDVMQRVIRHRP